MILPHLPLPRACGAVCCRHGARQRGAGGVFGSDDTRLPPASGGCLRHGRPRPAARQVGTPGQRGAVGVDTQ